MPANRFRGKARLESSQPLLIIRSKFRFLTPEQALRETIWTKSLTPDLPLKALVLELAWAFPSRPASSRSTREGLKLKVKSEREPPSPLLCRFPSHAFSRRRQFLRAPNNWGLEEQNENKVLIPLSVAVYVNTRRIC